MEEKTRLRDGEKGVVLQRDRETYAIAPHLPCGVVTPEILRRLADAAEKYQAAAVKVTSAARIALVGIREEDIDRLWLDLGIAPGHAVGMCVRSVKACPGTAFCRLGQQDSLGMGMKMDAIYHGMDLPSKTKIGVSGCPNQCAENCIKDIGLYGKKSGWVLTVGGKGTSRPRLADTLVEDIASDDAAVELVAKVVEFYKANAKKIERIGAMIDRIGLDALKAAVL